MNFGSFGVIWGFWGAILELFGVGGWFWGDLEGVLGPIFLVHFRVMWGNFEFWGGDFGVI